MLQRFYELQKEFTLFLQNKGKPVAEMEDESWLCDLASLGDITTHTNDLNTKLQQQAQYKSLCPVRTFKVNLSSCAVTTLLMTCLFVKILA